MYFPGTQRALKIEACLSLHCSTSRQERGGVHEANSRPRSLTRQRRSRQRRERSSGESVPGSVPGQRTGSPPPWPARLSLDTSRSPGPERLSHSPSAQDWGRWGPLRARHHSRCSDGLHWPAALLFRGCRGRQWLLELTGLESRLCCVKPRAGWWPVRVTQRMKGSSLSGAALSGIEALATELFTFRRIEVKH